MVVKCKVVKAVAVDRVYGLKFYYAEDKNIIIKIIEDISTDEVKLQLLCDHINSNDLDEDIHR